MSARVSSSMQVPVRSPASPPERRRGWLTLVVAGAFIAFWPLLLRRFGGDGVYVSLGLYGVAIVVALFAVAWPRRHALLHLSLRNVAIGLVVGGGMTVATYVAYRICVALFPHLAAHVEGLYAATRATSLTTALAWTLVVVVAEEALWRGPLLDVAFPGLGRRGSRALAIVLSLVTYAAVQMGTGSWVVALAALLCGAIWTTERVVTGSMVAPLISHAIWTVTVIHLLPVTAV